MIRIGRFARGDVARVAATGARVRAQLASTARADGRQDPREKVAA